MSEQTELTPEEIESKKTGINPYYKHARIVLGKLDIVYCSDEQDFYIYDGGKWRLILENELLADMHKVHPYVMKFQPSDQTKILTFIKTINYRRIKDFNMESVLNLKNGMVIPETLQFIEHDKFKYSTAQIDYEYKPDADCSNWIKALNDILEGEQEKINTLQEFFGLCLTKEIKYEKALLLIGESGSGKSTILDTLNAMLGKDNCSKVALKYFCDKQHTGMMTNKLVNIDSDVSSKAMDYEEEFKKIVTGEEIGASPKYVANYTFNPYCKVVMAANNFPRIEDHSSAFYRRLISIPCDRVFEEHEQDLNLKKRLKAELSGILNWSLAGLKRLTERGRFDIKDFTKESLEEIRRESNPTELFFDEHVSVVMGDEVEKGELYDKYVLWAKKNNYGVLGLARFSTLVFRKYPKTTFKDTRSKISNKRVWKNLVYVHFKNNDDLNYDNDDNINKTTTADSTHTNAKAAMSGGNPDGGDVFNWDT